ncbi:MAG: hypothetical protein NTX50_24850 [Candidatus Sumerlaeota bacterium]|nr:hypothetical protein [Candidatus Sumerlaeota bacterium]
MTKREIEQTRAWVENWKTLGPILEEMRRKELRDLKYEDHYGAVASLLEIGVRFGRPRTTSGMVEMQRLFMRARP